MEPSRTTSALQREIEASRARINQRRRSRTPVTPVRSVPTPDGMVDVRVDGPQSGVPTPITRADRLKNFVEQLRSSNQVAVKQSATTPVAKLTNHAATPARESQSIERIDYSSAQGQAVAKAANQEIADAITALDASRKKYSDLVTQKKLIPEHEAVEHAHDMATTKDDLVASISAAIATVLTDANFESTEETISPQEESVGFADPVSETFSQPPIVSQISHSLKSAQLPNPAVAAISAAAISAADATAAVDPPVAPAAAAQTKLPKRDSLEYVDPDVFNVGAFIPADIAAWDVEKFMWPMIIDQFLDIGEQAISRLANFSIDILDGSDHRLAVTSVRAGAGASTIACSVARWAAKMRKRVLLVDANLQNPALAQSIGLAPNISWLNVIRESLDVSEAIVRCKSTGVCVMPLGEIANAQNLPSALLDRLGDLLQGVHHAFDLIVIDTGVAGQLPIELTSSSKLVDAAMIVDSNVASAPFRSTKDGLLNFGVTKFVAAQNSI